MVLRTWSEKGGGWTEGGEGEGEGKGLRRRKMRGEEWGDGEGR